MGTRCESHRKEGLLSTPTNQKKKKGYGLYLTLAKLLERQQTLGIEIVL